MVNWLHVCSQFIGGYMEEKNEVVKQTVADLIVPDEQQFYEEVRLILR